ncbi:MAG: hypothetical protein KatS3mg027_1503 [Bacteroidia bacterium]|nr:MAG: hypothetical protein KatS3mg027_1503 [Bacteroidia bacterium]
MKWHLNVEVKKYPFEIHLKDKIFLMGSCFAENLSEWLKARKFNVYSNPNGILFNPESILINLKNILDQPNFFDRRFIFNDGVYYKSFLHQTHFFSDDKEELYKAIIQRQQEAHNFLIQADYLFITFGSAYVYVHKELNEVVANCHKLPHSIFDRKLLEIGDIVSKYKEWIQEVRAFNPDLKIIFSVSPVKYLSYGVVENNISKSILLLSVHKLCCDIKEVYYFPAYELVIDDLRDYRFFKEDMAHPNEVAVKYVMEKFSESMISKQTRSIVKDIEKILNGYNHKIQNMNSESSRKFAIGIFRECERLEKNYPYLNFSEEKEYFKKILESKED